MEVSAHFPARYAVKIIHAATNNWVSKSDEESIAMIPFLRLSLGALFLWSAMAKLRHWKNFNEIVRAYKLLPNSYSGVISGMVVIAEALAGGGLMTPTTAWHAALVGTILLVIFSFAVSLVIARGPRNTECGCMLIAGETIGWHILARNAFFFSFLLSELMPQLSEICIGLSAMAVILFIYFARLEAQATSVSQLKTTVEMKDCQGCTQNHIVPF